MGKVQTKYELKMVCGKKLKAFFTEGNDKDTI
jgi:hypothetical protein